MTIINVIRFSIIVYGPSALTAPRLPDVAYRNRRQLTSSTCMRINRHHHLRHAMASRSRVSFVPAKCGLSEWLAQKGYERCGAGITQYGIVVDIQDDHHNKKFRISNEGISQSGPRTERRSEKIYFAEILSKNPFLLKWFDEARRADEKRDMMALMAVMNIARQKGLNFNLSGRSFMMDLISKGLREKSIWTGKTDRRILFYTIWIGNVCLGQKSRNIRDADTGKHKEKMKKDDRTVKGKDGRMIGTWCACERCVRRWIGSASSSSWFTW